MSDTLCNVTVLIDDELFGLGKDVRRDEEYYKDTTIEKVISDVCGWYNDEIEEKELSAFDFSCHYDGTFLARSLTFDEAQIRGGDILKICMKPNTVERMGLNTLSFVPLKPYNNEKELETKKEWSDTAPVYRTWSKGLNIECTCHNEKCPYFKKLQIIPLGCGTFDMIMKMVLEVSCIHQDCKRKIFHPEKKFEYFSRCGFNHCYFRYDYITDKGEKGKSEFWIHAPHKPCYLEGYINSDDAQEYFKLQFEVMTVEEYQSKFGEGDV